MADTLESPPGPSSLPVIGNSYKLFREPLEFAETCAREYGDIVSLRLGDQNAVQITHPDFVQTVLEDNFEDFRKGEFYRTELDLLGEGLLISEGELWRQQRQIIGPIFHPDRIQSYFETMVEYAERAAAGLSPQQPVAINEHMQQLTLEILAQTLFSVDIKRETTGISTAVNDVMDEARLAGGILNRLPEWVPTPGNIRRKQAVNTFDSIVEDIIENHRQMNDPPDDVVSKLLEASDSDGEPLTNSQIRDEVLTLLLAGHDTTALALGYIWHLLGKHPEVQEEVHREIDSAIGDRSIRIEDIAELEMTERVIKEALRLYPPVYLFAREPTVDVNIGGYEVPKGTLILFNQWVVHRDPRFFDAPATFDPSRWTDGHEESLHPYAYYPFGGGPRQCIGKRFALLEMQIILATFFKRFRFELAFDPPLELDPKVSLRPAVPIDVQPALR